MSEGGTAYAPGGNTTLGSSDAPGTFGAVRLPQGLRIVWHYQQDGGQRTFTLRYRLRGVVIAHDDAVEVAPQVWGSQWKFGLRPAHANVRAAGALPGTRAWIEPAWLDHRLTVRARRGAHRRRRRAGPAQRDRCACCIRPRRSRPARPTPRTCTTTSCRRRSRASRPPPPARSATSASSRTRSTIRGPGSSRPRSWRSSRPALLGGLRLLALRARASDRHGGEVRARAARRPGARARAVAARATSHRRRRPDGRDAVRARAPRALQDDAASRARSRRCSACATRRSTTSTSRAATRASS